MTDGHEAVQELLAAHALHALDDEEANEAERVIGAHLPVCAECRERLEEFQAVAGELALAVASRRPPRLLAARLRRETRSPDRPVVHWLARTAAVGAAAALVAVVMWNLHLNGRVSDAETRQIRTTEVLATVSHPTSRVVPLAADGEQGATASTIAAAYVPGRSIIYLFGSLPEPGSNRLYQVWLTRGSRYLNAGTFMPEGGTVLVRIPADPAGYDGLLVTVESAPGGASPSPNHIVTATF